MMLSRVQQQRQGTNRSFLFGPSRLPHTATLATTTTGTDDRNLVVFFMVRLLPGHCFWILLITIILQQQQSRAMMSPEFQATTLEPTKNISTITDFLLLPSFTNQKSLSRPIFEKEKHRKTTRISKEESSFIDFSREFSTKTFKQPSRELITPLLPQNVNLSPDVGEFHPHPGIRDCLGSKTCQFKPSLSFTDFSTTFPIRGKPTSHNPTPGFSSGKGLSGPPPLSESASAMKAASSLGTVVITEAITVAATNTVSPHHRMKKKRHKKRKKKKRKKKRKKKKNRWKGRRTTMEWEGEELRVKARTTATEKSPTQKWVAGKPEPLKPPFLSPLVRSSLTLHETMADHGKRGLSYPPSVLLGSSLHPIYSKSTRILAPSQATEPLPSIMPTMTSQTLILSSDTQKPPRPITDTPISKTPLFSIKPTMTLPSLTLGRFLEGHSMKFHSSSTSKPSSYNEPTSVHQPSNSFVDQTVDKMSKLILNSNAQKSMSIPKSHTNSDFDEKSSKSSFISREINGLSTSFRFHSVQKSNFPQAPSNPVAFNTRLKPSFSSLRVFPDGQNPLCKQIHCSKWKSLSKSQMKICLSSSKLILTSSKSKTFHVIKTKKTSLPLKDVFSIEDTLLPFEPPNTPFNPKRSYSQSNPQIKATKSQNGFGMNSLFKQKNQLRSSVRLDTSFSPIKVIPDDEDSSQMKHSPNFKQSDSQFVPNVQISKSSTESVLDFVPSLSKSQTFSVTSTKFKILYSSQNKIPPKENQIFNPLSPTLLSIGKPFQSVFEKKFSRNPIPSKQSSSLDFSTNQKLYENPAILLPSVKTINSIISGSSVNSITSVNISNSTSSENAKDSKSYIDSLNSSHSRNFTNFTNSMNSTNSVKPSHMNSVNVVNSNSNFINSSKFLNSINSKNSTNSLDSGNFMFSTKSRNIKNSINSTKFMNSNDSSNSNKHSTILVKTSNSVVSTNSGNFTHFPNTNGSWNSTNSVNSSISENLNEFLNSKNSSNSFNFAISHNLVNSTNFVNSTNSANSTNFVNSTNSANSTNFVNSTNLANSTNFVNSTNSANSTNFVNCTNSANSTNFVNSNNLTNSQNAVKPKRPPRIVEFHKRLSSVSTENAIQTKKPFLTESAFITNSASPRISIPNSFSETKSPPNVLSFLPTKSVHTKKFPSSQKPSSQDKTFRNSKITQFYSFIELLLNYQKANLVSKELPTLSSSFSSSVSASHFPPGQNSVQFNSQSTEKRMKKSAVKNHRLSLKTRVKNDFSKNLFHSKTFWPNIINPTIKHESLSASVQFAQTFTKDVMEEDFLSFVDSISPTRVSLEYLSADPTSTGSIEPLLGSSTYLTAPLVDSSSIEPLLGSSTYLTAPLVDSSSIEPLLGSSTHLTAPFNDYSSLETSFLLPFGSKPTATPFPLEFSFETAFDRHSQMIHQISEEEEEENPKLVISSQKIEEFKTASEILFSNVNTTNSSERNNSIKSSAAFLDLELSQITRSSLSLYLQDFSNQVMTASKLETSRHPFFVLSSSLPEQFSLDFSSLLESPSASLALTPSLKDFEFSRIESHFQGQSEVFIFDQNPIKTSSISDSKFLFSSLFNSSFPSDFHPGSGDVSDFSSVASRTLTSRSNNLPHFLVKKDVSINDKHLTSSDYNNKNSLLSSKESDAMLTLLTEHGGYFQNETLLVSPIASSVVDSLIFGSSLNFGLKEELDYLDSTSCLVSDLNSVAFELGSVGGSTICFTPFIGSTLVQEHLSASPASMQPVPASTQEPRDTNAIESFTLFGSMVLVGSNPSDLYSSMDLKSEELDFSFSDQFFDLSSEIDSRLKPLSPSDNDVFLSMSQKEESLDFTNLPPRFHSSSRFVDPSEVNPPETILDPSYYQFSQSMSRLPPSFQFEPSDKMTLLSDVLDTLFVKSLAFSVADFSLTPLSLTDNQYQFSSDSLSATASSDWRSQAKIDQESQSLSQVKSIFDIDPSRLVSQSDSLEPDLLLPLKTVNPKSNSLNSLKLFDFASKDLKTHVSHKFISKMIKSKTMLSLPSSSLLPSKKILSSSLNLISQKSKSPSKFNLKHSILIPSSQSIAHVSTRFTQSSSSKSIAHVSKRFTQSSSSKSIAHVSTRFTQSSSSQSIAHVSTRFTQSSSSQSIPHVSTRFTQSSSSQSIAHVSKRFTQSSSSKSIPLFLKNKIQSQQIKISSQKPFPTSQLDASKKSPTPISKSLVQIKTFQSLKSTLQMSTQFQPSFLLHSNSKIPTQINPSASIGLVSQKSTKPSQSSSFSFSLSSVQFASSSTKHNISKSFGNTLKLPTSGGSSFLFQLAPRLSTKPISTPFTSQSSTKQISTPFTPQSSTKQISTPVTPQLSTKRISTPFIPQSSTKCISIPFTPQLSTKSISSLFLSIPIKPISSSSHVISQISTQHIPPPPSSSSSSLQYTTKMLNELIPTVSLKNISPISTPSILKPSFQFTSELSTRPLNYLPLKNTSQVSAQLLTIVSSSLQTKFNIHTITPTPSKIFSSKLFTKLNVSLASINTSKNYDHNELDLSSETLTRSSLLSSQKITLNMSTRSVTPFVVGFTSETSTPIMPSDVMALSSSESTFKVFGLTSEFNPSLLRADRSAKTELFQSRASPLIIQTELPQRVPLSSSVLPSLHSQPQIVSPSLTTKPIPKTKTLHSESEKISLLGSSHQSVKSSSDKKTLQSFLHPSYSPPFQQTLGFSSVSSRRDQPEIFSSQFKRFDSVYNIESLIPSSRSQIQINPTPSISSLPYSATLKLNSKSSGPKTESSLETEMVPQPPTFTPIFTRNTTLNPKINSSSLFSSTTKLMNRSSPEGDERTSPITSPMDITLPMTTEPVLNLSQAFESYWIITVIKVRLSINVTTPSFVKEMETNLAQAYVEAFQRAEHIVNGTYQPLRRRKRFALVEDIALQMISISRSPVNSSNNVTLVYYMEKRGKPVPAVLAVKHFKLLQPQEVAIYLKQVVVLPAKTYLSEFQSNPSQDWIIGAVLGVLASSLFLLWCILFIYFKCFRMRPTKSSNIKMDVTPQLVLSPSVQDENTDTSETVLTGEETPHSALKKNGLKKQTYSVALPTWNNKKESQKEDLSKNGKKKKSKSIKTGKNSQKSGKKQHVKFNSVESNQKGNGNIVRKEKESFKESDNYSDYEIEANQVQITHDENGSTSNERLSPFHYVNLPPLQQNYHLSVSRQEHSLVPLSSSEYMADDELRHQAEHLRKIQKQRLKEEKRKMRQIELYQNSPHYFLNNNENVDMVDNIPRMEMVDESNLEDLRRASRRRRHRRKERSDLSSQEDSSLNEAYECDNVWMNQPETLQKTREKMHKLLDDAFHLMAKHERKKSSPTLSPVSGGCARKSSIGKRRTRRQQRLNLLEAPTLSCQRKSSPSDSTPEEKIDRLHTPLFLHKHYSPCNRHRRSPAIPPPWNAAGDEAAKIAAEHQAWSSPYVSPRLNRSHILQNMSDPREEIPLRTTSYPSDRNLTDLACQPSFSFTRPRFSSQFSPYASTRQMFSNRHSGYSVENSDDTTPSLFPPASPCHPPHINENSIELNTFEPPPFAKYLSRSPASSKASPTHDEIDVIHNDVKPESTSQPLIQSIREELMRLSSERGERNSLRSRIVLG